MLRPGRARLQAAAALVVVLGVVLLLVVPLPLPWDGRLMQALEKASHVPLFMAGTGAVLWLIRPRITWDNLWRLLGVVAAVAVGSEVLQAFTRRDPGVWDALFSALGGGMAVLLWYSFHTERRGLIMGAWVLCALLGLTVVVPPVLVLADRAHAHLSFPLLASFEGRSEVGRWWSHAGRLSRVPAQATHGNHALRVALNRARARYPGLFMTDGPRDWSGYRQLCFDLYLTGGMERSLWVRADDRLGNPPYEARAQTQVTLVPGANSICLDLDSFLRTPDGHSLDQRHIVRWGMFFDTAQGGESFFLDHIRLTR